MTQGINPNSNIYNQRTYPTGPQNINATQMQGQGLQNVQQDAHEAAQAVLGDSPAGHLAGAQYDSMMPMPKTKEDWINFIKCFSVMGVVSELINYGTNKNCRNGNILKWGEKIDKFVETKVPKSVTEKMSGGANKFSQFKEFLSKKSKVYNAINTPTKSQFSLAKAQARGMYGTAIDDLFSALDRYGLDKIEGIDKKLIEAAKENPKEHIDKILKAIEHIDPKTSVRIGNDWSFFKGKITIPKPDYIARRVNIKEAANKVICLSGKGAETGLGKFAQKAFLNVSESIGNGVLGGKMGVLFSTFMFALYARRAFEAEKGDKVPTFMEEIAQNVAFFVMTPLGMSLAHRAGGTKYLGYKGGAKEGAKAYRKALNSLNEGLNSGAIKQGSAEHIKALNELKAIANPVKAAKKAMKKSIADGADKKVAKEAFKAVKKSEGLRFWQKPLKIAGQFLSTGLELPTKGLTGAGTLKNLLKRGAGFPIRFLAVMMVTMPILTNGLVKVSHMVFGKPKHSLLDDETKNTEQNKAAQTAQTQQQSVPAPTAQNNAPSSNAFVNGYLNQNAQRNNKTATTSTIQQNTPAQPLPQQPQVNQQMSQTKNTTPEAQPAKQRYVPSSTPYVQKTTEKETNKYNDLSTKADLAAKKAEEVLKNI